MSDENFLRMPPSKSHAIRAILAATLAFRGQASALDFSQTDAGPCTSSDHPILCDDIESALSVAHALGAHTHWDDGILTVTAAQQCPPRPLFDCGESALLFRTMVAVASFLDMPSIVKRRGTLLRRPVNDLIQRLQSLGAQINFLDEGLSQLEVIPCCPGQSLPRRIHLDCTATSQNATGMLFALSMMKGVCPPTLVLSGNSSRPYLEMTLDVLSQFGAIFHVSSSGDICRAPDTNLMGTNLVVEPDWSAAAFFLALFATSSPSQNLVRHPLKLPLNATRQADAQILNYLRCAGAAVDVTEENWVIVEPPVHGLNAFKGDLTDAPDLLPPLCALALFCRGTTRLTGIERTRHKESNRPAALISAFDALGAHARWEGKDALVIQGQEQPHFSSVTLDVHADHRIAMALAVIAVASHTPIQLPRDEQVVAKSFPRFFDALHAVCSVPKAEAENCP